MMDTGLWLDYTPGCESHSGDPIYSGEGKTNNDLENDDPINILLAYRRLGK